MTGVQTCALPILNFEMRKNVLKYDDVMNRQREVVYRERREVLEGRDLQEQIKEFISDTVVAYITSATAEGFAEEWDWDKLFTALHALYPISFSKEDLVNEFGSIEKIDADQLLDKTLADVEKAYTDRESALTIPIMREIERKILLTVLDRKWREHLYEMDYLQEGIGLRAMAQRDPLVEYQREGYDLFVAMMDGIKEEVAGFLFNVEVQVDGDGSEVDAKGLAHQERNPVELQYSAADIDSGSGTVTSGGVSRNSPCPCGSGKKYKRCHGAN